LAFYCSKVGDKGCIGICVSNLKNVCKYFETERRTCVMDEVVDAIRDTFVFMEMMEEKE